MFFYTSKVFFVLGIFKFSNFLKYVLMINLTIYVIMQKIIFSINFTKNMALKLVLGPRMFVNN